MMRQGRKFWIRLVPATFVLLWSTGFIGARYGLPYAEPFTFLTARFLLTLAVLLPVALVTGARWPGRWADAGHIAVSGLLVHATYLGGVFAAIRLGMPAGLAALITGVQPLLTALVARSALGERVTPAQWLGLVLGFAGVVMVLAEKMMAGGGFTTGPAPAALAFAVAALCGISFGTLYQKRFCAGMDLRSGAAIQYLAATVAISAAALTTETMRIDWSVPFVLALGWLVAGLSLGAITLLMVLIRRGAAAEVASLFYLVPPATAAEAWLLFGERLGSVALSGMAIAALGVALAAGRLKPMQLLRRV